MHSILFAYFFLVACILWQSMLSLQSAENDKRVTNISLFIYICCRDYIQIVATSPDLVTTCQDLVTTRQSPSLSLSHTHTHINIYILARQGGVCTLGQISFTVWRLAKIHIHNFTALLQAEARDRLAHWDDSGQVASANCQVANCPATGHNMVPEVHFLFCTFNFIWQFFRIRYYI